MIRKMEQIPYRKLCKTDTALSKPPEGNAAYLPATVAEVDSQAHLYLTKQYL